MPTSTLSPTIGTTTAAIAAVTNTAIPFCPFFETGFGDFIVSSATPR
jgi:hypothetical protein